MPQALDASSYIFQGVWINWSKGAVNGSTLTLSPANAAVLFAVLALFVQMTGSQLWTVIQFVFHQTRATMAPMDAMYHQQQAVLRNNTSDLNTFRQLFRVMWAWRRRSRRPIRRSLHLMIWAIIHFIFFGLAGVFSSVIVAAGDAALSKSPYCGLFEASYLNSLDSTFVNQLNLDFQAKSQNDVQLSQEYAQACYNVSTEPSSSCSYFPKPQLTWSTNTNATCPFDFPVCHPSVPAVSYDTGFIDSSEDLGLNAQVKDRILYRRLTTCSPLNDQAYITSYRNVTSIVGGPEVEAVDAYYGPSAGGDRNATYSFGNFVKDLAADQIDDANPYQLHLEYALSGAGWENSGSFNPIPQLVRPNADVNLVFLSFDKSYEGSVDDPWFSAHQKGTASDLGTNATDTVYTRDLPVTTLGCTEQHQVCTGSAVDAASRKCTPMMGSYQVQTDDGGVYSLNFTDRQNSTYVRLFQAALDSTMDSYLSRLIQRDMPLLARRQVILFVSSTLPANQWQLETAYWHSIAMAQLQQGIVYYGTGQMSPDTSFIAPANTTADKWLCQNLIVLGTSFQSFSVLALSLIFIVGLAIVLVSLFVEDIAAIFQRRWDPHATGREMWKANETLQLQRMLYECTASGGTWHDGPNGIPVTASGEVMHMLKVGDNSALLNSNASTQFTFEPKLPVTQEARETDLPPSSSSSSSLLPLAWVVDAESGRLSSARHERARHPPLGGREGV